jgi:hypothetical protein
MLGTWIATNFEPLRVGLWAIGLLAVVVAAVCVVRRVGALATTSAALAMALLSGTALYLILFVSAFAQTLR